MKLKYMLLCSIGIATNLISMESGPSQIPDTESHGKQETEHTFPKSPRLEKSSMPDSSISMPNSGSRGAPDVLTFRKIGLDQMLSDAKFMALIRKLSYEKN